MQIQLSTAKYRLVWLLLVIVLALVMYGLGAWYIVYLREYAYRDYTGAHDGYRETCSCTPL